MSTCKLVRKFSQMGYETAVFSFAVAGHCEKQPSMLFRACVAGGTAEARNLAQLRDVVSRFGPDVVINQMPYEHEIGDVLKENKRYLLLGCLRNTLYSVKGNLEAFVARTAPGPLKRLSGVKAVQAAFLALHRRRHRADLLKILNTYDHFVMFGPPNIEELRYFVPEFEEQKIRLVPNSIPEVASAVPLKEKRLLWLGRVAHEQKQAELILPIWERVSQMLPDWELDVVGDGPLLEGLKTEAREKGVPRIHFYGRQVPDEYYRRATIFFMTSAFEGFPNTLIEAQGFGCIPVLFDTYPVARWIVDDGKSGFLIPPFQIRTMADRILELARHPSRTQLAEQALESARRFHIDRVGQLWQVLFEAEVSRNTTPASRERIG